MSYPLETARHHRPPPISIHTNDAPQELATSPFSMLSMSSTRSPTSPSFSSRPRGGKRLKSPPPSHSPIPSKALQGDLETFAEQCRLWYYNQDEEAGRLMTQTLTTLPPSQRPPFARLQASVRSGYHAHVTARRNAEYQAHLSATLPGGSLSAHSRLSPNGPTARKERSERLETFIRTWCTLGMPGTRPFFEAMWAVMRLQTLPENLGGAGSRRITWEIDDAVFQEAAGKEFMLEAINFLKGVLGFEDVLSPNSRSSSVSALGSTLPAHSRVQSQPLLYNPGSSPPISSITLAKRPRAPSDPFLDTPPLSRSLATTSSASQIGDYPGTSDDVSANNAPANFQNLSPSRRDVFPEIEAQARIWTAPDLTNPEYTSLLKLFPSFISAKTLPRFPVPPQSKRIQDIEEGVEQTEEPFEIRFGTGMIRLGGPERTGQWRGGWWARFTSWCKTLFC